MLTLVPLLFAVFVPAVAAWRPGWLLPTAVVASAFEGAAVLNVPGIALSPYYYTLVWVAARCLVVDVPRGRAFGRTPAAARVAAAGIALCAVGLAGAAVLPAAFAGTPVCSPRLSEDALAPLEFSTSNVGQAAYLVLNAAFLWFAAQVPPAAPRDDGDAVDGGEDLGHDDEDGGAARPYFAAGVVVLAFGFYQLAAAYLPLPFPSELLYSNATVVFQIETQVLGLPRLCSTFTEPAGMSVFLVGYAAFLALEVERRPGRAGVPAALLAGACVLLALSTSSTAIVGLGGLAAAAALRYAVVPAVTGRADRRMLAVLLAGLAAAAATWALSEDVRDLFRTMVLEKGDSSSYRQRSEADAHAWWLVRRTFGFGVGLGGNRASGFLPSAMSTIGVAGTAALAAVVLLACRPGVGARDALRRATSGPGSAHRSLAAAVLATVAAKAMSSPDLSTPALWAVVASATWALAAPAAARIRAGLTTADRPAAGADPGAARGDVVRGAPLADGAIAAG